MRWLHNPLITLYYRQREQEDSVFSSFFPGDNRQLISHQGVSRQTTLKAQTTMIAEQTKAPAFTLPDSEGKQISLSDFTGKKVLIIFYPGDDTPVCTAQLCDYRNNVLEFTKRDIVVLGISSDSQASHKSFAERNQLPFTLLSDTKKTTAKAYDALGFLGMSQRAYVLVDENGVVLLAYSDFLPIIYQPMKDLLAKIDAA